MQQPDPASTTSLYLLLGSVVAQVGGLIMFLLRDRAAARRAREERQHQLEDRNQLVMEVQERQERAMEPVKKEISGAADDRRKLMEILDGHTVELEETKKLVKKQSAPRDKNARERESDRASGEGEKRHRIRRSADSHTAATAKLAEATDQAAAATSTLADTVKEAAEDQKASAKEIAVATAKVAVHAVEQAEIIAENAKKATDTLDQISQTVKRIEDKS